MSLQFHKECLDTWMSTGHTSCPLDGDRIKAKKHSKSRDYKSHDTAAGNIDQSDLSILGIGSSLLITSAKPLLSSSSQRFRKSRNRSGSDVEKVEGDFSELTISGIHARYIYIQHLKCEERISQPSVIPGEKAK